MVAIVNRTPSHLRRVVIVCALVVFLACNTIRYKFPALFESVVLGSHNYFFQWDQRVEISLCLAEATTLHQSRKLASLKPS